MNPWKSLWTPMGVSLAIHGAAVFSVAVPVLVAQPPAGEPIQIDYVAYDKMTVKPAPERSSPVREVAAKDVRKKRKGIPVPALNERAKREAAESDLEKLFRRKLQDQQRVLSKLTAEEAKAPSKSHTRTSAEMMADPQKGKVFVSYFGDVKRKIQETLTERYAHKYSGRGSVTLLFVLSSDGRLEKVVVADQGSVWDPILRDLAIQCLREAAPFGPFPADLGKGRIAFNLTVSFEGS